MKVFRSAAIVGMLAATALAGVAGAAEVDKKARVADETPAGVMPAWIVTCSNANLEALLKCQMRQSLLVAATRQNIVTVTMVRDQADKDALEAVVQLPHGISFKAGLTYWVDDGKKRQAAIAYADAQGSYATLPVKKEMIETLKSGKVLRFLVQSISGNKTILELSLARFADSLKYL